MASDKRASQDLIGSELIQEDASYADIVVQFVDGLSKRLTTMEDAVREADLDALRGAAHQLKGSGGGYGYPILTELARELEERAKAGTLEECAKQVDELKEVAKRIVVSVD